MSGKPDYDNLFEDICEEGEFLLTHETSHGDIVIKIESDCMEPEYMQNDMVAVEYTSDLDLGEVGLFLLNGETYIRKYDPKGLISLKGKDRLIEIGEEDTFCIVGRVLGRIYLHG